MYVLAVCAASRYLTPLTSLLVTACNEAGNHHLLRYVISRTVTANLSTLSFDKMLSQMYLRSWQPGIELTWHCALKYMYFSIST